MPELIKPIDEFIHYLKELDYTWINFGNGLLFVFTDDKVNVRQYYEGECLSSWVDIEKFFSTINQLPTMRMLKDIENQSVINEEENNNE